MTGSRPQWYNGMMLLGSFFACRLVWGTWQSFNVYRDVWNALRTPGIALYEDHALRYASALNSTSAPTEIAANAEVMKFATVDSTVPAWLAITYLGSNIVLNSLNWFWFSRMIETVTKRFRETGKEKEVRESGQIRETEDGKQSISVERTEVRRRRA